MKLETLILEKLKTYPKVEISGFGTFYLKNSEAKILEKTTRILPPGQEIALEFDYQLSDQGFARYLAGKMRLTHVQALDLIATHSTYWKNQLSEAKELSLEGLGAFFSDAGEILFHGERLEISSPDQFGLEAIDLKELKEKKSGSNQQATAYTLQKSAPWVVLLLIPVAGLIVLALTDKELLFGKRSVFSPTSSISKPKPPKDSVSTPSPNSVNSKPLSTLSKGSSN